MGDVTSKRRGPKDAGCGSGKVVMGDVTDYAGWEGGRWGLSMGGIPPQICLPVGEGTGHEGIM
jgi:hypothetical protein